MNTDEIHEILCGYSMFKGVYARDQLRNVRTANKTGLYVVNLDKSDESGSHWTVLVITDNGRPNEYFDSFCQPPPYNEIEHFLDDNYVYLHNENDCLQSILSSACGPYCVYFSILRMSDGSFESIASSLIGPELSHFSRDLFVSFFTSVLQDHANDGQLDGANVGIGKE